MVRRPPSTRPRSVTYTAYGVFTLGVINGWRVVALWQQRKALEANHLTLDPMVRLVAALLITLISVWLAAALWRKNPFTRRTIPFFLLSCALYRMVLLGLWVQSPVIQQGWWGEMIGYAAAILFTVWALNRRASQSYFSKQ